ncbi:uncharacterized protein LOC127117471 [Lathyrus oleraceus]|uniref:uncharacterized protein LOC127117471 n=1 Tax=Pisum sativum TaxID=3888 RepID=UPI0021CDFBBE|nr:uncharacterized protein LOC127117471 [Pisum sativum]
MGYLEQLIIKFVLPISLFCVLFVLPPLFSQSLKSFLMQFFCSFDTNDESYMFLLCILLLAFIILFSILINVSSSTSNDSEWLEYNALESGIEEESISSEDEKDEDNEIEELNKKCEDFIKKMKASFYYEMKA